MQVARIFNVTESSVYGWQKAYREGGLAALSTKIASGRKRLLTDKQMLELSRYLRLNPRQLEFDFGLWTRKLVRELIRTRFGIDYSEQNVGRILKMLGFSPQRPVYQALERMRENGGYGWRKHSLPLRNAPRRRGRRSSSQMRRGAGQITTPGEHGARWPDPGREKPRETRVNRHGIGHKHARCNVLDDLRRNHELGAFHGVPGSPHPRHRRQDISHRGQREISHI